MTTAARTVVVTGLGATTPLAGDVPGTWQALLAGRSGARPLTESWAAQSAVRFACRAAAEPGPALGPALTRRTDRSTQFALVAAREAWQDAGLPQPEPDRLGVVPRLRPGRPDLTARLLRHPARTRRPPGVPAHRAHVHGERARRPGRTGIRRTGRGAHDRVGVRVRRGGHRLRHRDDPLGAADIVIAGGAEAPIHPLPMAAFANMMALSKRNDAPERASRPYDKGRDGFVMGEGAGVLVLESAEHAAARGAASTARRPVSA